MRLFAPLIVLGFALAALLTTPAETPLLGLDHRAFAGAAGLVALLAAVLSWTRPADLARALGSVGIWAIALAGLVGA